MSFQDYGKLALRNKALSPLLGSGIFSQDGAEWKHARDHIKPLFTRSELSDDIESFKTYIDRFLGLIPRGGSAADLQPLLLKLFLDSSIEFIFGESVNYLLDTPSASQKFLDDFSKALLGADRRAQAGRFRFIFMLSDKEWKKSYEAVHGFIDKHVARALAETETGAEQEKGSSTSHRYVLIREMAKQIRDPVELRFQVLNVYFPARETPGVALSNAFFNLALLKSLPLFKYVLYETLRLRGPSGRIARNAVRDTILPRGGGLEGMAPVFVPKGTTVALNTYAPNHWKDYWGDDVEEFRPKCWIGTKHRWDWTPFFGGPRVCPAQQQVLT
ncbi:MAG: hypothetical protein MMC33_010328 [Icmadophila ericetorum]|nr:hypothetical protein [Icmadophila ericetorum]